MDRTNCPLKVGLQISISKIEKGYHIYLIIIIAVVIYTSVIVLPYNAVGKTLHSLEIESNSIVQNVPSYNVGESPVDIAVDDYENIAYVANSESDTVSVIDGDTLKVSNINVGERPVDIAVDEDSNTAYVANSESNTVSVIDWDTLKVSNINVGERPVDIAVDEDSNTAYVANRGSNTVSVIDGDTLKVSNINVFSDISVG